MLLFFALLQVVGEAADLAWAPIHAYALHCLFLDRHPTMQVRMSWPLRCFFQQTQHLTLTSFCQRLAFLEELCPFTDFIPSATLLWYVFGTHYLHVKRHVVCNVAVLCSVARIACNQQYIIAVLRRWLWHGGMSSPEHAMHAHMRTDVAY